MAFSRVNPLGWALFEELTSAQMNQLDINVTNSLDILGGGVYNVGGDLTLQRASAGIDLTLWFDDMKLQADDFMDIDAATINIDTTGPFILDVGTTWEMTGSQTLTMTAGNDVIITALGDDVTITAADYAQLTGPQAAVYGTTNAFLVGTTGVQILANNGDVDIDAGTGYGVDITGSTFDVFASTSTVSIQSSTDMTFTVGDDCYFDLTGGTGLFDVQCSDFNLDASDDITITATAPGVLSLSGEGGLIVNQKIEYNSDKTHTRYLNPQAYSTSTQWTTTYKGITVTDYGGEDNYQMIPIPENCTGLGSVTIFFTGDTEPGSTGLTAYIGKMDTFGNVTTFTSQTYGLTHIGDRTWVVPSSSGSFSAGDQLYVRIEAPIGGTGVNLDVYAIGIALTMDGVGSW